MVRVQYVQASVHPTGDITETLGCQYLAVHVLSVSLVCPLSLILRDNLPKVSVPITVGEGVEESETED